MTKRWGPNCTSDLGKSKRLAAKQERQSYRPEMVKLILEANAAPVEATFDNADDMMKWLNS